MTMELEECIKDGFDDSLRDYIRSEEYVSAKQLNILASRVLPQLSVIIVISHVPQLCFKQLPATSSIHCTFYHF